MSEEYDLGLGSRYEKFILSRLLRTFIEQLEIRTVCEYPANNLMGNNSEEFEKAGCRVTKKITPDLSEMYDLVWNFCEFERSSDSMQMICKMLDLSRKYMFVVVQNSRNIGVLLHRIWHFFVRRKWDHGRIGQMSLSAVKRAVERENALVLQEGYFDAPWFILDMYESGRSLRSLASRSHADLSRMKDSPLEGVPNLLKRWLAHHAYVLGEKPIQATSGR